MFSVTGSGTTREEAFSSLDKHIRDALQLIKE